MKIQSQKPRRTQTERVALSFRSFPASDSRCFRIRNSDFGISTRSAFTMIEIALCIAIIGFALVAIIGVLPTAMRVQHDNSGDTLIDQDGQYFLEAIRHGAQGIDDLVAYVIKPTANHNSIRFVHWDAVAKAFITNPPPILGPNEYNTGRKLIGLLSIPRTNDDAFRVEMEFRGISGAAVEKDPNSIVGFEYLLVSEVVPFSAYDPITTF